MYIEFTGCSSSGKSTISERVISLLGGRGHKVISVHATHFSVFGPTLQRVRHPTLQNLLLDIQGVRQCLKSSECLSFLRFANALLRRHADSLVRRLNLQRGVIRKLGVHGLMTSQENQTEYRLVDEGIVHSAHNLFVHVGNVPDDCEIEEFTERVPLPDLIVRVRAPLDTLVERTLRRSDRPIPGDEAKVRRYLEHGCLVFDKITAAPRLQKRTICLDYDGCKIGLADTLAEETLKRLDAVIDHA
jgi:hypothetical protein